MLPGRYLRPFDFQVKSVVETLATSRSMERLKRTLSFRKHRKTPKGQSSTDAQTSGKPNQWLEDEVKVRDSTCSFQVRYLGCIEVFESRGIQVCEEAVKALKARKNKRVWSRMSFRKKRNDMAKMVAKDDFKQGKSKYQRAVLYVSGDALRVVDEISKGLIVDQTIEKVSFCAPDRNNEKGFAYICRDGTTRRWICHGFLALKETVCGERLSHAVGCAFAICLEKKQKREKDSVSVTYNENSTSFTRLGSFRQVTLTERLADPQSAIIPEPIPTVTADNPYAVKRPKATDSMLERQYSFRGFDKLSETSPFKRQMSLRPNDLPSTIERQLELLKKPSIDKIQVPSIAEVSPSKEQQDITDMCQQLTEQLSQLNDEPKPNIQNGKPEPIKQKNPWDEIVASVKQDIKTDAQKSVGESWLESTASSLLIDTTPNKVTLEPKVKTLNEISKDESYLKRNNENLPQDPFDIAWQSSSTNPFHNTHAQTKKTFEVSL